MKDTFFVVTERFSSKNPQRRRLIQQTIGLWLDQELTQPCSPPPQADRTLKFSPPRRCNPSFAPSIHA